MTTKALDKNFLKMTSPEPLVQIQFTFTEMLLIMPSAAIVLTVMPRQTRFPQDQDKKYLLLNHWSKCKMIL